jgi:hypothetical protein
MVNYENGCIYKLCCKDVNVKEIYIGSTVSFKARKSNHKHCCNIEGIKGYEYYVYSFIRDNGGFENWDMIEVEKYKATDKKDLEKRERHWVDTLGAGLNNNMPMRTKQEWYQDNKEVLSEKYKERYQENKEHILECGKKYTASHKEEIALRKLEKVLCECGETIRKDYKSRHIKCKKHLDRMKTLI